MFRVKSCGRTRQRLCSSQHMLFFVYVCKNSKVTHINVSVYICIEACWVPGRKLLLPTDVIFFTCSRESQLLKSQLSSFNKWTTVVLTPLHMMHQGLCCCFLLFLSPCFLGVAAAHSQSLYRSYPFGFFPGGAAVLRPNNLWSTPPLKIHHGDYIEGIPLNAQMSGS